MASIAQPPSGAKDPSRRHAAVGIISQCRGSAEVQSRRRSRKDPSDGYFVRRRVRHCEHRFAPLRERRSHSRAAEHPVRAAVRRSAYRSMSPTFGCGASRRARRARSRAGHVCPRSRSRTVSEQSRTVANVPSLASSGLAELPSRALHGKVPCGRTSRGFDDRREPASRARTFPVSRIHLLPRREPPREVSPPADAPRELAQTLCVIVSRQRPRHV